MAHGCDFPDVHRAPCPSTGLPTVPLPLLCRPGVCSNVEEQKEGAKDSSTGTRLSYTRVTVVRQLAHSSPLKKTRALLLIYFNTTEHLMSMMTSIHLV